MAYNYTFNNHNYLVHFNKNHSPKNGQFTFGDGDGDGIIDDHRNQKADKKSDPGDLEKIPAKFKGNPPGRAKPGESVGFHRAENFLKYPYYVDKNGYKYYYNTVFDLPKGERGRAYVQNLGKIALLPVGFGVAVGTLIKDAKDVRKYKKTLNN